MKKLAIVGAGIVGICNAFYLQKSGYKVTLIDNEAPGSMTSYGHACTFADYANIPVNSPSLFKNIPKMLFSSNGPLAVDFFYIIKNLPWIISFLRNCRKAKVEEIANSLGKILQHGALSYEQIFKEVDVSQYIRNQEAIYIYDSKKSYEDSKYSNTLRKKNNIKVQKLNKKEIHDLEPNLAPVYYAGELFPGSRYTTNPLVISKKIFEYFLLNGGNFINKKVKNLSHQENSVEVIFNNKSLIFDEVIISAGAWSNLLAKMIGDNFPLETERGYHVSFENKQRLINRPIGWSQSGFYLVPLEEGIRAAGTVEIAGLNKSSNENRTKMIEKQSRRILPQLGKVKSTWMGRRPTLPDSMPVIGRSTKNKNILYSFGHQHIGWTLAAVTGNVIKDLVNGSKPNFDISPFSPKRFNQ